VLVKFADLQFFALQLSQHGIKSILMRLLRFARLVTSFDGRLPDGRLPDERVPRD
jgi:hypothetical protein